MIQEMALGLRSRERMEDQRISSPFFNTLLIISRWILDGIDQLNVFQGALNLPKQCPLNWNRGRKHLLSRNLH